MSNKYYVYDEDNIALRWFYCKADAIKFVDNNTWTIILKKKPKLDLYALLGESPF